MTQVLQSILVILLSLMLLIAGSSLLGTLLGVRMALEEIPTGLIGLTLAFHSVGFVLGTLYCTRIIRRVGHIRSFAAFAAIACVAALLHPLYVEVAAWAALRGVVGFASAGLLMVMDSWINDRTSNDLRGTIMATYMGTTYFAQGGGQFALGLAEPQDTTLFIVSAALICTSLIPLALTRSKAPLIEEHERMGFRRLFEVAPIAVLAAVAAGAAMSSIMAVLPVYAKLIGYGVDRISVLMGTVVLVGVALQWPIGRLSDRHDRRAVMTLVALLAAGACIPLIGNRDAFFMLLAGSSSAWRAASTP